MGSEDDLMGVNQWGDGADAFNAGADGVVRVIEAFGGLFGRGGRNVINSANGQGAPAAAPDNTLLYLGVGVAALVLLTR